MGNSTKTEASLQTVRLRKGKHASPARGACVMELSSMLAGERFTDHPSSVCPVIAAFLRSYNDTIPPGQEDELFPYASLAVGTRASRRVQCERACRILEWIGEDVPRGRRAQWSSRWPTDWDSVLQPAVRFAVGMPPVRRRLAVARLLSDLVDLGRRPEQPTQRGPVLEVAGTEAQLGAPATTSG